MVKKEKKKENEILHSLSQPAAPSPNSSVWYPRSSGCSPVCHQPVVYTCPILILNLDLPSSLPCPQNCLWTFVDVVPSSQNVLSCFLCLIFQAVAHVSLPSRNSPWTFSHILPICSLPEQWWQSTLQGAYHVSMLGLCYVLYIVLTHQSS